MAAASVLRQRLAPPSAAPPPPPLPSPAEGGPTAAESSPPAELPGRAAEARVAAGDVARALEEGAGEYLAGAGGGDAPGPGSAARGGTAGEQHLGVGDALRRSQRYGAEWEARPGHAAWGELADPRALERALERALDRAGGDAPMGGLLLACLVRPPECYLVAARRADGCRTGRAGGGGGLFGVLDTHGRAIGASRRGAAFYRCGSARALAALLRSAFVPLPADCGGGPLGTYGMFELAPLTPRRLPPGREAPTAMPVRRSDSDGVPAYCGPPGGGSRAADETEEATPKVSQYAAGPHCPARWPSFTLRMPGHPGQAVTRPVAGRRSDSDAAGRPALQARALRAGVQADRQRRRRIGTLREAERGRGRADCVCGAGAGGAGAGAAGRDIRSQRSRIGGKGCRRGRGCVARARPPAARRHGPHGPTGIGGD